MGRAQQNPAHAGVQPPWSSCAPQIRRDHIPSDPMPCCIPHPPASTARPSSAHSPPQSTWKCTIPTTHGLMLGMLHLMVCAGVLGRGACPCCHHPPLPAPRRTSFPMEVGSNLVSTPLRRKLPPSTPPAPARAALFNCSFLKSICCFQRFE